MVRVGCTAKGPEVVAVALKESFQEEGLVIKLRRGHVAWLGQHKYAISHGVGW